ncbi:hypothetical protein DB775_15645, partial [Xanthomonas perforans]
LPAHHRAARGTCVRASSVATWTTPRSLHGRTCRVLRDGGRARPLQTVRRSAAPQVIDPQAAVIQESNQPSLES